MLILQSWRIFVKGFEELSTVLPTPVLWALDLCGAMSPEKRAKHRLALCGTAGSHYNNNTMAAAFGYHVLLHLPD
jgi:hypothetical protein